MSDSHTHAAQKFETTTVQAVRGTVTRTIAKREEDGWELVSPTPGKLRTELVFRRPKPPIPWRTIIIGGSCAAVLAAVILVMSLISGHTAEKASTQTTGGPTSSPTSATSAPVSSAPAAEKNASGDDALTPQSNAEFAALLGGADSGPGIEAFAKKYAGRIIEFDAKIADLRHHDGAKTRFDWLILSDVAGAEHEYSGPSFQFRDMNYDDLHLTEGAPDSIVAGQKIHVVARVLSYSEVTTLFQLKPIKTTVR